MEEKFTISLSGYVNSTMADKFIEFFTKIPKGSTLIIELNSPGGELKYAHIIGNHLLRRCNEIDITIIGKEEVSSAAIRIFASGTLRYAYEGTKFHFHMPIDDTADSDCPILDQIAVAEVSFLAHISRTDATTIHQLLQQGITLNAEQVFQLNVINMGIIKNTQTILITG